jgi:hypothetical protein
VLVLSSHKVIMKFGKLIEQQAISEWQNKYIDYDHLKKLIAKISHRLHVERLRTLSGLSLLDKKEDKDASRPLTEEEKEFLSALTTEVNKVEEFYYERLEEIKEKKKVIELQLTQLGKEESPKKEQKAHLYDKELFDIENGNGNGNGIENNSKNKNKNNNPSEKETDRWQSRDPAELNTEEKEPFPNPVPLSGRSVQSEAATLAIMRSQRSLDSQHSQFMKPSEKQVVSLSAIDAMSEQSSNQQESKRNLFAFNLKSNIFQHLQKSSTETARIQIKKALLELYRAMELLKSYREMNVTAYRKIVKKFEKNTHNQMKEVLIKEFEDTDFYKSKELEKLMKEVENTFRIYYTHGNRSKAKKTLRTVNTDYLSLGEYVFPIYTAGMFTGFNILLVIFILIYMSSVLNRSHPHTSALAVLYFGFGMPLLLANLVTVCLYVWDAYKINYRLVFGISPNSSTAEYGSFVAFVTTIYLILIFLSLAGTMDGVLDPPGQVWLVLGLMVFVLLSPIPTKEMYPFSSRTWLFTILYRILVAPLHTCRFKDFFVADHLISIAPFFISFGLLIYATSYGINDLNGNHISFGLNGKAIERLGWYVVFFAILPYFWRCIQSLRRYYDGLASNAGPTQLWNAFRYFIGICFVITQSCHTVYTNMYSNVLWVYLAVRLVWTTYSLYWDIVMDWGLGSSRMTLQKTGPNENMILYPAWVYFFVIITDTCARYLWVPILFTRPDYSYFILALVEVLRRFQWDFFRVELEHVHNCEKYQVTADVKLPFASTDLFMLESPEAEDGQDGDGIDYTSERSGNELNAAEKEHKPSSDQSLQSPQYLSADQESSTVPSPYDKASPPVVASVAASEKDNKSDLVSPVQLMRKDDKIDYIYV